MAHVVDISDDANSGSIDVYMDGQLVTTLSNDVTGVIPNTSLTPVFVAGCYDVMSGDMLVDWAWWGKSRRCERSMFRAGSCTTWDGDENGTP